MATAPKAETKGPNQLAYENGWGAVAVPIKPYKKSPVWDGWSNPLLKYDPNALGYEPEGFDISGCGVGIRCGLDIGTGQGVWAFDIDVLDWQLVGEIMQVVREHLGVDIVTREGNAPKVLVPVRVQIGELDGWKPNSIKLGNGHKIEMWYKGRQFVVNGIHPDTGKAYKCSTPVLELGPKTIKIFTGQQIKDLWKALETRFSVSDPSDAVSSEVAENGGVGVGVGVKPLDVASTLAKLTRGEDIHENLTSLTASLVNSGMDAEMARDWLRKEKVLETLPRDIDRVGDLDDDRSEIGRALVGAVAKYGHGSKWEFLNDGLRGVASGAKAAVGEFSVASKVGASLPEDNPFAVPSEAEMVVEKMVAALTAKYGHGGGSRPESKGPLKTVSTGWDDDPHTLPMTPFLDEAQTFLKGAVMALQGKPGTNKSTWVLNYLLHLMTGVSGKAFGAEVRLKRDGTLCETDEERETEGRGLRVLYLSADDATEVVKKRMNAWRIHWKVPKAVMASLNDRFHVMSVTEGVMGLSLDTVAGRGALRELVERETFDIVVGDPAANLIPQSDAANDLALGVMKSVIGEMSDLGVAALFCWHVNKAANAEGAESKLGDIRGASAIGGAIRGAKDLRELTPDECKVAGLDPRGDGRRYRKMSHTKNSYGKLQDDRWYRVVGVVLGNDKSGLAGDEAAVVEPVDMGAMQASGGVSDETMQDFLTKLIEGNDYRQPYSDTTLKDLDRSVFEMTESLFGWDKAKTKRIIKRLTDSGYVTRVDMDIHYPGSGTKKGKGLLVHSEKEIWSGFAEGNANAPF